MSYGIEETKEFVKWGLQLGMAVEAALQDGKISWLDATSFMKVVTGAPKAITGIDKVPKELGDMDAAEKKELSEYIKLELDLENDGLEDKIEKGLALALELYGMVKLFTKKDEPADKVVAPSA